MKKSSTIFYTHRIVNNKNSGTEKLKNGYDFIPAEEKALSHYIDLATIKAPEKTCKKILDYALRQSTTELA